MFYLIYLCAELITNLKQIKMAKTSYPVSLDNEVIAEIEKRAKKQVRSKSFITNELLIVAIGKTKSK